MRRETAGAAGLVLLAGLVLWRLPACAGTEMSVEATSEPVAVVELFTSEGCSSCPPADKLLSELSSEAGRAGRRLVPLSLHVDYWDHLGWRDPWSAAEWTARQRGYARAWRTPRIYTPQMVVNGRTGFVGSNRAAAEQAIADELRTPAAAAVGLTVARDGARLTVDWRLGGAPRGARLHLLVTESGLVSDVKRGENEGRVLAHDHVARVHRTLAAEPAGTTTVDLPDDLVVEQSALVALVEAPGNQRLLGAARAPLP